MYADKNILGKYILLHIKQEFNKGNDMQDLMFIAQAKQFKDNQILFNSVARKQTNRLTLRENDYEFQRSEDCYCLLESCDDYRRTWLIIDRMSNIDNVMMSADAYLSIGDAVLIVLAKDFRSVIEKYEDTHRIVYACQYGAHDEDRVSGLAVDVFSYILDPVLLIQQDKSITYAALIEECSATIKNTEWQAIEQVQYRNDRIFPVDALRGELSALVQDMATYSGLDTGFIASNLIGVLALYGIFVRLDGKPLIVYSMTVAPASYGKSSTVDYFIAPLVEKLQELKEEHDKAQEEQEHPRRFSSWLLESVNWTWQGLLRDMKQHQRGLALSDSDARAFFASASMNNNEINGTLGAFCKNWDGKTTSYKTRDINEDAYHDAFVSLSLAFQPSFLKRKILQNEEFFESGFMARTLILQRQNENTSYDCTFNDMYDSQFNDTYDRYKTRMKQMTHNPKFSVIDITSTKEVRDYIKDIAQSYKRLKESTHYQHTLYNRAELTYFIDRIGQHIARIAGLLAMYENKNSIDKMLVDRAHKIVDYFFYELVAIIQDNNHNEVYTRLLDKTAIWYSENKGKLMTTTHANNAKFLRKENSDPVPVATLIEYYKSLEDVGLIRVKKSGKSTIIKIHPDYKPRSLH